MEIQIEGIKLQEMIGLGSLCGIQGVGVKKRMGQRWERWKLILMRSSLSKVSLESSSTVLSHGFLLAVYTITGILQSIQRDWDFMTDAECIPVNVALSLMDTSTLGKADREPEFLDMYSNIQRTLKAIVNGSSAP